MATSGWDDDKRGNWFSLDEGHPEFQIGLNAVERAMQSHHPKICWWHWPPAWVQSTGFIYCMQVGWSLYSNYLDSLILFLYNADRKCDGQMKVGFIACEDTKENYVSQIIVCQNKIKDSITFQTTKSHELVNYYLQFQNEMCMFDMFCLLKSSRFRCMPVKVRHVKMHSTRMYRGRNPMHFFAIL